MFLQEAIEYLNVQQKQKYIDATLGGVGHTQKILELGGIVLGLDIDQEAIEYVKLKIKNEELKIDKEKLFIVKGNFRDIKLIAEEHGFNNVSGIIYDLGVSSYQFDIADRGFSFQKDAPLDMRMDKNLQVTAGDLVNSLTKGELYELFTKFGEETFSRAISSNVVRARGIKKIETTKELAKIVASAYPIRFSKIHPATKVFQALRIVVNDELNNLRSSLPQAVELLKSQGRLVVISFHSLEDRIVKQSFKAFEQEGLGKIMTKKPIVPSEEEITNNPRSRSAKLRVFEKK